MKRKTRVIEVVKTVLIVLLFISAFFLSVEALLVPQQSIENTIKHWTNVLLGNEDRGGTDTTSQLLAASLPSRIAIVNGSGRRGVQYDATAVSETYAQVGGLLAEALDTAGTPAPMEEELWREALQRPGCYFEFWDSVPLDALGAWMNSGKVNETLTASARRLLLWEGETGETVLSYINAEDGLYYTCRTGEILQDRLSDALASFLPNGATFAFEQGEAYDAIDPYTMVLTTLPSLPLVNATAVIQEEAEILSFLKTMGFNAHSMAHYTVENETVYKQGSDTIRIENNGTVQYTSTTESRDWATFPVEHGDSILTRIEAIEAARSLAAKAFESYLGEGAALYLSCVEQMEDGAYRICFGCSVGGVPVLLSGGEYTAEFEIANDYVKSFSLKLRNYSSTGTYGALLPEKQAIAALEAMEQEGGELMACYIDSGQNLLQASWVTR